MCPILMNEPTCYECIYFLPPTQAIRVQHKLAINLLIRECINTGHYREQKDDAGNWGLGDVLFQFVVLRDEI